MLNKILNLIFFYFLFFTAYILPAADYINNFPEELLHKILLDRDFATKDIISISRVCSSWRRITKEKRDKLEILYPKIKTYISANSNNSDYALASLLNLIFKIDQKLSLSDYETTTEFIVYILKNYYYNLNINQLDIPDFSLSTAVIRDSEYAVKLLLSLKADPNIKKEITCAYPLHVAARRGNAAIAKILLDYGADKSIVTCSDIFGRSGETPLQIATNLIQKRSYYSNPVTCEKYSKVIELLEQK